MSFFYRNFLRPALFTQQAEDIHNRTMRALKFASGSEFICGAMRAFLGAPALPTEVFGLKFPNPVGLAAGMDKTAEAVPAWEAMGFGFTELGAATWHAQPGNPQPRVFRAIPEEAIVNRMGFNNPGAEAIAEKIVAWKKANRWPQHPVGINLGKSKITPLEKAAEDYANSFRVLREHLDFFVVNVSSPNTPNLRQLQDKAALDEIFAAIQEAQTSDKWRVTSDGQDAGGAHHSSLITHHFAKPILVKVAPDLTFEALDEILTLIGPRKIAGIVATNTTISRPQSSDPAVQKIYGETGGLSGKPLRARSTEVVKHLFRQTRGQVPIIGVGGIFSAADAWEKISAGASLVQIYTGLVYEGPAIAKEIVTGLIQRMEAAGIRNLRDAVGCEAK